MPVFPSIYKKYCDRKLKIVFDNIRKKDSVLDAGCGDKNHQYAFLQLSRNYKVTGIDFDNSWNPNIIKGDITNINFADGSFDVVVCLDVLEHIENWEKVFDELV